MVTCLTVFPLVFRFLFPTGGDTVVTPALVSISDCVMSIFTQFAFGCNQSSVSPECEYTLSKATLRTYCITKYEFEYPLVQTAILHTYSKFLAIW
jgi:hypothetical protein